MKMKKLIVMAGVALGVLASEAATVAWNSGTIYDSENNKVGKDAITAILWESTSSTAFSSLTGQDLYDAYKAGTVDTLVDGAKVKTGASTALCAANLTTGTAYDSGTTVYAALLYVETANDNYISNFAQATASSAKVTTADLTKYEGGSFGGTPNGPAISGWTSGSGGVPEPTSGLLLLLGGAMLALRRKQK